MFDISSSDPPPNQALVSPLRLGPFLSVYKPNQDNAVQSSPLNPHSTHEIATPLASPTSSGVPSPELGPLPASPPPLDANQVAQGLLTCSLQTAPYYTLLKPDPPSFNNGEIPTPRTDPSGCHDNRVTLLAGKYLLIGQQECCNFCRCVHVETKERFVCKMVENDSMGRSLVAAHIRVNGHPQINQLSEIISTNKHTYLLFPPSYTDLHTYVRTRRRLREAQARPLFRQIVAAIHEAHSKGIILRDLKLRKFVFADESRTELKLESFEDAVILDDDSDDLLSDKHGCPAYVSPEILKSNSQYSGRAADMWGLGVMLYTMLIGRYPFHGQEHNGLFAKIRRGSFSLPDTLSSRAKCLIRCLLRKNPQERLNTEDVMIHPWMTQQSNRERYRRSASTATVANGSVASTAASSPANLGQFLAPTSTLSSFALAAPVQPTGFGYYVESVDQLVPDSFGSEDVDMPKV